MSDTLFRFIWENSKGQQLIVVALTLLALPFYYASLELPKLIINQILGTDGSAPMPLGLDIEHLGQVGWLVIACLAFLLAVGTQGGIKYALNVYKGRMGGQMLLTLRRALCVRLLNFPEHKLTGMSSDELGAMIGTELSDVGSFAGDAVATPLLQGGLLLTAITFIFMQDVWLGFAAIALFPVQGFVVPRLQRQVNALNRERVLAMRRLAARLGETADALVQVQASATSGEELDALGRVLQRIYEIRNAIYRRRSFIKLLNNFLFQVTPFLFLLIGGLLVIQGDFTIGALVAVLAAYKDLPPPARDLLDYYQSVEEVRLKYEQVVTQFDAPQADWATSVTATERNTESVQWSGNLTVSELGIAQPGDGELILKDIGFALSLHEHLAITGLTRAQSGALARALVGLSRPTSGSVSIAGTNAYELSPDARSAIAFLDEEPAIFHDTLRYNLFYGLGESAQADTEQAMLAVESAQLHLDMQHFGMNAILDTERFATLAERLVAARRITRERLSSGERALIEPFDETRFCAHATIGENLIWGQPLDAKLELDDLSRHPSVRKAIRHHKLTVPLQQIGMQVARAAIAGEHVADSSVDHPLVHSDELAALRVALMHADPLKPGRLSARERAMLHSIALRLVPARHTTFTVDDALRNRVVKARNHVSRELTGATQPLIAPLDPDLYNPGLTVRDNLLFGAVVDQRPEPIAQIESALTQILRDLDLESAVSEAGLEFIVGNSGRRLTPSQRQRVNFARARLRGPKLSVICGATVEMDAEAEEKVLVSYLDACRTRAVVWMVERPDLARHFDRVLVFVDGRLVERGHRVHENASVSN